MEAREIIQTLSRSDTSMAMELFIDNVVTSLHDQVPLEEIPQVHEQNNELQSIDSEQVPLKEIPQVHEQNNELQSIDSEQTLLRSDTSMAMELFIDNVVTSLHDQVPMEEIPQVHEQNNEVQSIDSEQVPLEEIPQVHEQNNELQSIDSEQASVEETHQLPESHNELQPIQSEQVGPEVGDQVPILQKDLPEKAPVENGTGCSLGFLPAFAPEPSDASRLMGPQSEELGSLLNSFDPASFKLRAQEVLQDNMSWVGPGVGRREDFPITQHILLSDLVTAENHYNHFLLSEPLAPDTLLAPFAYPTAPFGFSSVPGATGLPDSEWKAIADAIGQNLDSSKTATRLRGFEDSVIEPPWAASQNGLVDMTAANSPPIPVPTSAPFGFPATSAFEPLPWLSTKAADEAQKISSLLPLETTQFFQSRAPDQLFSCPSLLPDFSNQWKAPLSFDHLTQQLSAKPIESFQSLGNSFGNFRLLFPSGLEQPIHRTVEPLNWLSSQKGPELVPSTLPITPDVYEWPTSINAESIQGLSSGFFDQAEDKTMRASEMNYKHLVADAKSNTTPDVLHLQETHCTSEQPLHQSESLKPADIRFSMFSRAVMTNIKKNMNQVVKNTINEWSGEPGAWRDAQQQILSEFLCSDLKDQEFESYLQRLFPNSPKKEVWKVWKLMSVKERLAAFFNNTLQQVANLKTQALLEDLLRGTDPLLLPPPAPDLKLEHISQKLNDSAKDDGDLSSEQEEQSSEREGISIQDLGFQVKIEEQCKQPKDTQKMPVIEYPTDAQISVAKLALPHKRKKNSNTSVLSTPGISQADAEREERYKAIFELLRPEKGRHTRDPQAPKRPLNAYNIFFKETRDSLKENDDEEAKCKKYRLAHHVSKLWRDLPDARKKYYEDEAEKNRIRYTEEMREYERNLQAKKPDILKPSEIELSEQKNARQKLNSVQSPPAVALASNNIFAEEIQINADACALQNNRAHFV